MNLQNYDTKIGNLLQLFINERAKTETFRNQYLYLIAQRNVDKNNS